MIKMIHLTFFFNLKGKKLINHEHEVDLKLLKYMKYRYKSLNIIYLCTHFFIPCEVQGKKERFYVGVFVAVEWSDD